MGSRTNLQIHSYVVVHVLPGFAGLSNKKSDRSQCLKMLLHLEIVEHWERKGLPSPPLNPFLHLHMVEHWERKGIPPPSLDPFLQLTKRRHVRQNSRW